MNEYESTKRKPNTKKWICPIDQVAVNTRGAAAYLRNKYGISWDSRYLTHPELLSGSIIKHFDTKLYAQIVSIFSSMDFNNHILEEDTKNAMYRLFSRISDNSNDDIRINKFIKDIESITPSGFNFDN